MYTSIMKIRATEVIPNVLVLSFETNYELAMSFVRLQEFYESPEFQGKVFSLEEYMDYWAREFGNGSFDYPVRWAGFNIPGNIILDWMDKFQYDKKVGIRNKEITLIEKILSRYSREKLKKSYIIGAAKGKSKKDVVDHEIAHAMFTLNPRYKKACQKLFKKLNSHGGGQLTYKFMEDKLLEMGYANELLEDEIQAYWSTSKTYDKMAAEFKEIKQLKDTYKRFRESSKK